VPEEKKQKKTAFIIKVGCKKRLLYTGSLWLSKNAQGAGGSSPCRVWAEPTFLMPQHLQESTASTEGARFAALTDKNEVFRQAETAVYRQSLFLCMVFLRDGGDFGRNPCFFWQDVS